MLNVKLLVHHLSSRFKKVNTVAIGLIFSPKNENGYYSQNVFFFSLISYHLVTKYGGQILLST